MILTVLAWVVTVLLVPVAFALGWFAVYSMFNLVWTIKAQSIGREQAFMRTESARGTVDGGSLVLLTGFMPVAHATWEDDTGEQHVAIGPVISEVRPSDSGVTRLDGTVLLVSDDDWRKIRHHHSEVHRLRRMRGGASIGRQNPPEMLVARGMQLPEPPLVDDAADWSQRDLPLASLLPSGTEVEVRYDPSCPDDARIMCDGGQDGTFISGRDIAMVVMSLAYGWLLFVATIAIMCALHGGGTVAWVIASCTGILGSMLRRLKWSVIFRYEE